MQVDALDLEILACLEKDGRATHAAIGREVGIRGPAVYARIRRMEKEDIILGYRINTNRTKLGRPLLAFVRVTTRPIKTENDSIEPFVLADRRILECHDITGEDTYLLKVECTSPEDLRDLLLVIRAQPQVIRTASSVVLVVVKEAGVPPPKDPTSSISRLRSL